MKMSQKKKLLFIHLTAMLLLLLAVVLFCEEIQAFKQDAYYLVVSWKNKQTAEESAEEEIVLQPAVTVENPWFEDAPLIYHAGGGINSSTYTNALEAVQATLDSGGTIIEIDFDYTSDGHLVCVHEWRDLCLLQQAPTLEEFCKFKVQGEYTPMTAEDLIGIMQSNPQMYLVTDTKNEKGVVAIAEDLIEIARKKGTEEVLDRVIFQLYGREKASIQELYPFSDGQFLFTVYKFGFWDLAMAQACNDQDVPVITAPFGMIPQEDLNLLRELGFTVYEHTVNRVDEAEAALARGVSGFYTDFLTPEDLETTAE